MEKEHTHHLDADLRNVYARLAGRFRRQRHLAETQKAYAEIQFPPLA